MQKKICIYIALFTFIGYSFQYENHQIGSFRSKIDKKRIPQTMDNYDFQRSKITFHRPLIQDSSYSHPNKNFDLPDDVQLNAPLYHHEVKQNRNFEFLDEPKTINNKRPLDIVSVNKDTSLDYAKRVNSEQLSRHSELDNRIKVLKEAKRFELLEQLRKLQLEDQLKRAESIMKMLNEKKFTFELLDEINNEHYGHIDEIVQLSLKDPDIEEKIRSMQKLGYLTNLVVDSVSGNLVGIEMIGPHITNDIVLAPLSRVYLKPPSRYFLSSKILVAKPLIGRTIGNKRSVHHGLIVH